MEGDKRKRPKIDQDERNRLKKLKEKESGTGTATAAEEVIVPTEDEVEEFFAILRRMKVAVKYFDDKGKGGKEWRETLEQAEDTFHDDGKTGVLKKYDRQGFDLNAAAPEASESDDA